MAPQFWVGFPSDDDGGIQQEDPQEHWANGSWTDGLRDNFHQKDIQAVHDRLFDPNGIDFQRTRHETTTGGPSMLRPIWGPQRCWLPLVWEPALADAKFRDVEEAFRESDPKWGVQTLSRSRRWTTFDPKTGRPNGIHIESFRDVFHEKWHDLVRILRDFAKKYNIDPFDENASTPTKWTSAQRMMFLMIAAIIEYGILSDIPAMMNIIDNYSDVMGLFNGLRMGAEPNEQAFGTGAAARARYTAARAAREARNLLNYPNITRQCHANIRADITAPVEESMNTYIREILKWAEDIRPILRYLLYTQIFRQERNVSDDANRALAQKLFELWETIELAIQTRAIDEAEAANVCDVLPEAFKLYFKWGGKPPGPPDASA